MTINSIIGTKTNDIDNEIAKKLTDNILGLPGYFSQLLIIRSTNNPTAEKMNKT